MLAALEISLEITLSLILGYCQCDGCGVMGYGGSLSPDEGIYCLGGVKGLSGNVFLFNQGGVNKFVVSTIVHKNNEWGLTYVTTVEAQRTENTALTFLRR